MITKLLPSHCLLILVSIGLGGRAGALIVEGTHGPLTVTNHMKVEVVSPPLRSASVAVGGTASSTLGFDISLNFINPPSSSEAAAFAAAEATWESLILGYQDTVGFGSVTIDVNLGNIDGVGGTLGSAGPTSGVVTSNFLYATVGSMNFDTSDIPGLGSAFEDVVLHEMGHVLGIGTLWSASAATGGSVTGRQELYTVGSGQYTGLSGLAAYNAEFGQSGSFIPVELGGGPGTANGHWNEVDGGAGLTGITEVDAPNRDFRNELMTGWLNDPVFISDTTVRSMEDLGYIVVPEAGTSVLFLFGGLALAVRRRR